MILRSDNFYLFLLFGSVVSSFVFCIGFFPYSLVKPLKVEKSAIENSLIDKTVLMIIDALRLDFIDSESFSYVHQLLEEKEACLLKLQVNNFSLSRLSTLDDELGILSGFQVNLPTVTKPRIKVRRQNQNKTLFSS
jgi:predicted AlkP superfamily pyrophosphatase or phosphodiesterase